MTSRRRLVLAGGDPGDSDRTLHGGPERIAETITELEDVGVTHLIIEVPGDAEAEVLENLDWFGREVVARRA